MTPAEKHVLIVDDEPSLVKMMALYLQRLGYAVTACGTTEEAALMDAASFAVAVVDATMDGLHMEQFGLQMLRANPHLRLLAASGYPVDMSVLEAAAPGRVAFLHKPFTPEMLAASVRRMLAPEEENV